MKTPSLAVCAVLAACSSLPASDETARGLAHAETAFAAQSMREDMRRAFIAHFAPDGQFLRGKWVAARAWLEPRPAPPIVLDWRPQYVEVARSGDMGLSTGPWKLTSRDDPAAAPAYGQFVSLWTRAKGEPWRVLVDHGISHDGPQLWDAPLVARTSPAVSGPESLPAAEAELDRLSRGDGGLVAAYRARGADDLRLYRTGEAPHASRDAALASPTVAAKRAAWWIERYDASASGDFGYAFGRYTVPPATATVGHFFRVWRRETAGWRIVVDVATPLPAS